MHGMFEGRDRDAVPPFFADSHAAGIDGDAGETFGDAARNFWLLVIVAAVAGLGVYWLVTQPSTVAGRRAARLHAERRQRQDDVRRGRLRVVPRQRARTIARILGGGMALPSPFGTFYVPNISQNPVDGIGRWSEADFVTAMLKGTSPSGTALLSRVSLQLLREDEARGRARPVRLPEDVAAGGGQGARPRRAVSLQHPPQRRRLEIPVLRRQAVRRRRIEVRRSGTAAPISSTARAIAPNATARATRSAASSPRSDSPADRIRKARAGFRTSRRRACRTGRTRTSPIFSKPGKRRKVIRSRRFDGRG